MLNRISRVSYNRSLGLLLVRVFTGAVFVSHGWQKIENLQGVTGMMAHLGVVAPVVIGPFIAYIEVIGGLMLILGIATRVAGVVLGIEMLAAVFLTGVGRGFGAHEFELLLMATSFGIVLIGSGRFSLYRMECKNCGGLTCKGGGLCIANITR